MANIPINITGFDSNNKLILSPDTENDQHVNGGDIVTWLIMPNSGVASIIAIRNYDNSPDVFEPNPAKVTTPSNSENWQGTIKLNIPAGGNSRIETYFIEYMKADGSGPFTSDPKIQVDS